VQACRRVSRGGGLSAGQQRQQEGGDCRRRRGKALFHAQRERPRHEAYELACEVMAQNMMDENTDEGINAFLEKRPPVWRTN